LGSFVLFLIIFYVGVDLLLLLWFDMPLHNDDSWKSEVALALGGVLISVTMTLLGLVSSSGSKTLSSPRIPEFDFLTLSTASLFTVAYIFLYTYSIYSQIPQSVGGGELGKITVVLKEDKSNINVIKLLCKTDSLNSQPITAFLIMEGPTDYYLKLSDSIITLPKSATAAVIFRKEGLRK
jgi:hypothetical protein